MNIRCLGRNIIKDAPVASFAGPERYLYSVRPHDGSICIHTK